MNIVTEHLRGLEIAFATKPGLFSQQGLDKGTRLLIDNMQVKDKSLVADLGCGAGVIGLVAAKLNPHGHVHLLDVNLRAVETAQKNIELSKIKNVEVYLSDQFSAVQGRTYHLILANPPQALGNEFLDETAKECFSHLKVKGEVYWVVKSLIRPVGERLFEKYFGNCTIVAHGREHVVLKAQRR